MNFFWGGRYANVYIIFIKLSSINISIRLHQLPIDPFQTYPYKRHPTIYDDGRIDLLWYISLLEEHFTRFRKMKPNDPLLDEESWPLGWLHILDNELANYVTRCSPGIITGVYKKYSQKGVNCEKKVIPGLVDGAGECHVTMSSRAYFSINHRGVNGFMSINAIGALTFHIVNGDYTTLTYDQKFKQDGSHRCKEPKCMRHICMETRQENIDRVSCPGWVVDPHGNGSQGCKHSPKCLFITTSVFDEQPTMPSSHFYIDSDSPPSSQLPRINLVYKSISSILLKQSSINLVYKSSIFIVSISRIVKVDLS